MTSVKNSRIQSEIQALLPMIKMLRQTNSRKQSQPKRKITYRPRATMVIQRESISAHYLVISRSKVLRHRCLFRTLIERSIVKLLLTTKRKRKSKHVVKGAQMVWLPSLTNLSLQVRMDLSINRLYT